MKVKVENIKLTNLIKRVLSFLMKKVKRAPSAGKKMIIVNNPIFII